MKNSMLLIRAKARWLLAAILLTMAVLSISACSEAPSTVDLDIIQSATDEELTFEDVRPTLERRCVVCHGCYDAPCQLKLSSMEGVKRGANKLKVYNKKRFTWQQPTRLFIDAQTTDEWREMDFYSVLNESDETTAEGNLQNSLLYKILRLKQLHPLPRAGMLPEDFDISLDREQVCTTLDKFDEFAEEHPLWGMPYALPNLSDREYKLLARWLANGAKPSETKQMSERTEKQITKWEDFFNVQKNKKRIPEKWADFIERPENKRKWLVSRYIYEHLSLGHLHLEDTPKRLFFRLVRSRTPPGQTIDEIATVRPYDDPEVEEFYYRLRPYAASIVEKSHIVYELTSDRLNRYQKLFAQEQGPLAFDVQKLPVYNPREPSNWFARTYLKIRKFFGHEEYMMTPFTTFKDIPPSARYQFLLDDARFFVNGFIKGPVCRGQSALSSIEDHFWLFFLKPENPEGYSQHGLDSEFLDGMDKYLHLPTELADTNRLVTAWINYWPKEQEYMRNKLYYYRPDLNPVTTPKSEKREPLPKLSINTALEQFIWNGAGGEGGSNRNAALTVFRHFDSASVHYGLYGENPETAWVIDYPIFERLHYLLVAGYNPFGVLGHQLGARLYMDFLRMEGEDNFLYFLPADVREQLYNSWHAIDRKTNLEPEESTLEWLRADSVDGYKTGDKKQELYRLLREHLASALPDQIDLNRCGQEKCFEEPSDNAMQKLASSLRGQKLDIFPEVSYVRICSRYDAGGKCLDEDRNAYTLIHNKSYREDTFAKEENDRSCKEMENDTLTVMKGLVGSYPNFFFDVHAQDLDAFIAACKKVASPDDYERMVAKYGVRRTNSDFWEIADWFQDVHLSAQPMEAGLFDLNRYKDQRYEGRCYE